MEDGGERTEDASGTTTAEGIEEIPAVDREYSRFEAAKGAVLLGFVVVVLSFDLAMTSMIVVYAPETLQLGPNSSILTKANRLFVAYIEVVNLDEVNRWMLYGFYKTPPLDVLLSWSEIHKTSLHIGTYKEWMYCLNKGSEINISYSTNSPSSSSLIIVIAQGNGTIQKAVLESSAYYVAVGNLNTESVKVQLNIRIKALVFNTTGPYYECIPAQGQCRFRLFLLSGNAAVITSARRQLGGMIDLVLVIVYFLNHIERTEQETIGDQSGDLESERNLLLPHREDDLSSLGSSNSAYEDFVGDAQSKGAGNENRRNNAGYIKVQGLCEICYDAALDCLFLPCGHFLACFACALRIADNSGICPICRETSKKAAESIISLGILFKCLRIDYLYQLFSTRWQVFLGITCLESKFLLPRDFSFLFFASWPFALAMLPWKYR